VSLIREGEASIIKLRGDLDQANFNLRKALRASEHTKPNNN